MRSILGSTAKNDCLSSAGSAVFIDWVMRRCFCIVMKHLVRLVEIHGNKPMTSIIHADLDGVDGEDL